MIIPYQQLTTDALESVIEDWLSRQAQEMDVMETDRQTLIKQVHQQLKNGDICVTWDDESQTINLLPTDIANAIPPSDDGY